MQCIVVSIPNGKGKDSHGFNRHAGVRVSIPNGKGKGYYIGDDSEDPRIPYQFPMGKVKKTTTRICSKCGYKVSIPNGKGKVVLKTLLESKIGYQFPMGKVKEKEKTFKVCIEEIVSIPNGKGKVLQQMFVFLLIKICINSQWER